VALLFDLSIEDFEHILLDPSSGAVGFHRLDADLPEARRQPSLALEAYRALRAPGSRDGGPDSIDPQAHSSRRLFELVPP